MPVYLDRYLISYINRTADSKIYHVIRMLNYKVYDIISYEHLYLGRMVRML